MRKELLNHRPTSALRGQSPLCESVGTGHTSTHPSIFTKVLLVLLTTLLLPSAAWGENYPITVAGVQVTDANAGNITGDGITGKVSFTLAEGTNTATLTLDGVTITGSIVKTASEAGDQLTINLVGTNTVNGQISFQDRTLPGDLTFTGTGSLNIASNDENGVIDGVSSVNTSEGLYLVTDSPNPYCHNGYYINSTNADDNSVKSLTVSTSVTYPIWVYNSGSSTKYTQLTAANSSTSSPFSPVSDDDHSGSVSFNGTTLTLNSFNCKETNGNYVFYIGESKKELTINLDGTSCIFGNCFHYLTGNNTLTFITSDETPGSLEFTTSPSFWGEVTFVYSSGLGYYSYKISTDWPRLQIGNTFVRGDAKPVEGYDNVSFDDATSTLTLGGVTIGTQNSTNIDITVYIKDLNVEISGTNTVYGRFYGSYEEDGIRAGTITFKKKSGAETAELTVSGLGDAQGPVTNFVSSTVEKGLYLSGINTDNDPVSSLSYNNGEYYDFDNPDNQVKEVLITSTEPGTKLWIGEKAVTSDNAGNVFDGDDDLDGKVSYDAPNHILSLNGATIEDEIISNVGTLTIDITGSNSINSISASGNATALAFTGDGTLTLKNSDGIISNFSSVDTGDFNLLSNSTPGIHWNATSNKFMDFANDIATELTLTKATVYQLWVGGVQVTGENQDGITGVSYTVGQGSYQSISGTVSFNPTGNILTLTDASIGSPFSYCEAPIISNLPNLEININKIDPYGGCHLEGYQNTFIDDGSGCAKSLNTDATLVFSTNYTSSSEAASPTMQIDCYDPIASGFKSIGTSNQIIYKRTSNYYWVQRIAQPTISLVNGSLLLSDKNEIDLSYTQNSAVTLKYKITDAAGTAGEEKIFDSNTNEPIENPCTIDAWAVYQSQESELVTGKYFGIADKTIVFNNETKGSELKIDDLEIIPATKDEGVSFTFRGVDKSDVINPSLEGSGYKLSITGIGRCEVSMEIDDDNATIQVLNPFEDSVSEVKYAKGVVTVLPDKPSIEKDSEHDYLNTDKITITRTSVEGEDADDYKIFYTWSDDVDDVEVETYQQYVEGGSVSIYDPAEKIPAQTGKLWAWVGYHEGAGMYYTSDVVSEAFTVKTDISDYTVQGLATSATYTGAAIEPAFSVKASADAETSLTLNTDYTVSYQSVIIAAGDVGSGPSINYTDVDEMVEVGAYRIVITGTGDNYGGTTYADFAIDKADLDIVTIEAIADQTYTGSEITPEITVKLNGNTLSASDYGFSIGYSNNINVATSTSANAPTVTITATEGSNYFTAGTTKVANFNIVQKSLTDESISVTLSASSFTYNGDIQYPVITVKDGETTLTSEAYGYSYSQDGTAVDGPATAGTYTLTIYGKGNYTGEITKEITITPKEIATADITVTLATTSYTFDGTEHKPEVSSVTISDVTDPIEYEDAVYTNNVNAALATATENAPTVTVSLKGNYSGTGVATFTIEQADLSDYVVTGLTTPTAYTGSPITPTFSVKATETAETSLTANTDYSVKYQQAGADVDEMKDAGDYKIIITGEGNYKGSLDADFTIDRAQLNLTINLKGWAYGDTPNEPSLQGNLGEGDITWEYKAAGAEAYSAWSTLTTTTDAGTYMVKATVAETDNYEGGSKEAEFVIEQLDISQADITLDNNELTYNGEQQTVNVTKVMAGNIEVPIDCYEVSGNTEKEAGDYKLTVTAKTMDSSGNPIKNNFTGSAEKNWKIKNRTVTTDELGLSENQSQATYYSETEDLEVPEGVVAYIITGVNGNNVVTQRIRYIPKGVAVFVEQTTSTENPLEVIPDASELPLKGTAVDLNVASISGGTVYVLYKGEFVKSTTGTIPAKRCYLLLPNNVAAGTRAFGIIGGGSDGSTAIKSINDEPSTIDNWYDMGGHRIEKPTKTGIYIKNGKKVAIK